MTTDHRDAEAFAGQQAEQARRQAVATAEELDVITAATTLVTDRLLDLAAAWDAAAAAAASVTEAVAEVGR